MAVPLMPATTPKAGSLPIVLEEKKLKVTILLDVVKLLVPAATNSPTRK
jgi:hypothetical protein